MKRVTKNLSNSVNCRLNDEDTRQLDELCRRLDLERSEIIRRAVREGLRSFSDAKLPGVVIEVR